MDGMKRFKKKNENEANAKAKKTRLKNIFYPKAIRRKFTVRK